MAQSENNSSGNGLWILIILIILISMCERLDKLEQQNKSIVTTSIENTK